MCYFYSPSCSFSFFFNATATSEIYTRSLHDALPISAGSAARHRRRPAAGRGDRRRAPRRVPRRGQQRSEEHTSELQSRFDLVCRLLLEKKNEQNQIT